LWMSAQRAAFWSAIAALFRGSSLALGIAIESPFPLVVPRMRCPDELGSEA
jgi:hypothetical protein